MKPLLFLDVDGVLNAIRGPGSQEETFECMGYQIHRCKAYFDVRFPRLFEEFEVYWTTTWAEKAPKFIAPIFDIPECAVLEMPFMGNNEQKFAALIEFAGDRPFVWIDDDAKYNIEAKAHCKKRGDCLIIAPHVTKGLNREMLDAIFNFVENPDDRQKYYLFVDQYDPVTQVFTMLKFKREEVAETTEQK